MPTCRRFLAVVVALAGASAASAQQVDFARDVLPLLSDLGVNASRALSSGRIMYIHEPGSSRTLVATSASRSSKLALRFCST